MKKYLIKQEGNFYKANLHTHTTVSDGCLTPEEVKEYYKAHGYSVVAYTDHDVMISHSDLADENFLPLNGYEMEITESGDKNWMQLKCCHMCFVAVEPDNLKQVCYHRSKYLFGNAPEYKDKIQFDESEPDYERVHTGEKISEMMKIGRDNGFFVTLNHLNWSLETYDDYMEFNNMHAMEIFNTESVLMGFDDYNEKEYEDLLRGGKRIYCIATDDSHSRKSSCVGFTMIKANNLEYREITKALLEGNFYASHGPLIHDLWFEDGKIHIDCSDAASIVLRTGVRRVDSLRAEENSFVNSAEFEVRPEDGYVRITVTDAKGNHANTNAYFTDELFAED